MPLTLAPQEPFLGSGVAQATRFFMSFLAQHRTARAVPLPKSVALALAPGLNSLFMSRDTQPAAPHFISGEALTSLGPRLHA